MPLFAWEERFSVGSPVIDAQHKHLVQLVNELHDAMRDGQANEVLGGLLGRILSYTQTHFTTEERLMTSVGYPGLAEHHAEHEELTRRVNLLVAEWRAGRIALSMQVVRFLKDWLQTHIIGSDQKYVPHLRQTKPGVLTGAR